MFVCTWHLRYLRSSYVEGTSLHSIIEEFQFLIFLRLCARTKYRKMHCQASLGVSNVKISSLVTLQLIAEQCFLQHLHSLQRSA